MPLPRFDTADILDAIDNELLCTQAPTVMTVEAREREGDVWKLQVRSMDGRPLVLDESLEGQNAWWLGPPRGAADVLSVVPEDSQVNLRFATVLPPGPNEFLLIYARRSSREEARRAGVIGQGARGGARKGASAGENE